MATTSVLVAACGRAAGTATAPPDRIANLRSTSVTELDADEMAAEALDVEDAAALLNSTGFRSAVERSYVGSDPGIRRVVVRVVRFGSPRDAERYVGWIRAHVPDVIGDARPSTEQVIVGVPIHVHLPDGCCAKETALALAAWSRGTEVVRVLVGGPDADGPRAAALVADLYRSVAVDA